MRDKQQEHINYPLIIGYILIRFVELAALLYTSWLFIKYVTQPDLVFMALCCCVLIIIDMLYGDRARKEAEKLKDVKGPTDGSDQNPEQPR